MKTLTRDALSHWHDAGKYSRKSTAHFTQMESVVDSSKSNKSRMSSNVPLVFPTQSDIQEGLWRKEGKKIPPRTFTPHQRCIKTKLSSQQSGACSSRVYLQRLPQPPTRSGTQNYELMFCSRAIFDRILRWQWWEWPPHKCIMRCSCNSHKTTHFIWSMWIKKNKCNMNNNKTRRK